MAKKINNSAKMSRSLTPSAKEYTQTLTELKKQIQEAQVKAALAANKELIKLYWLIGKTIAQKQQESGWGAKVIEQLSKDIQGAFPGLEGFSPRNLFRMRAFYLTYRIVTQAASQLEELPLFKIPWFHNVILMQKLKDTKQRLWYAQKAIEHGWSRTMLESWIKSNLYARDGKAITNFNKVLPNARSDMAQQSLKDPYLFDFLTLRKEHFEKEVEDGLVHHIQKFLVELGQGFAFVGRQYHLVIDEKDYYIDLLFYNFKLRCFVVVELKARDFDPRDTGQISFYLAAIDSTLKHKDDEPTIGLILCKSKKHLTVEYALRTNTGPIGVASYETQFVENLPKELRGSLPTIEEIEAELKKQKTLSNEHATEQEEDTLL